MTLTKQQEAAASGILDILTRKNHENVFQVVLAGYAGTGKTFTTQRIASELKEANYRVAAITHTAKALSVLSSALPAGVETMTVFRALGWSIDGRTQTTQKGRHRLSGYDVVIVDEASMIDLDMYQSITRAAGQTGARVMWVGDPAQLPPITETGELSPVFQLVPQQYRLTEVVRQAEGSPIIRASMYVRRCLELGQRPCIDALRDAADSDAVHVVEGGPAAAADIAISAIDHGLDARVLCWSNAAVNAASALVARHYHPPGSNRIIDGDPVMFATRMGTEIGTDEMGTVIEDRGETVEGPMGIPCLSLTVRTSRGLRVDVHTPSNIDGYLQSMSRMTRELASAKRARKNAVGIEAELAADERVFEVGGALHECREFYANLRHVYAMTVHKSQGSTFETVVVDWRDLMKNQSNEMLCRLLYVAVTRPSKYLAIVV